MKASADLRSFVSLHQEVEGVVQHVGRETWDLILVDVTGLWTREEFASQEEAREAAGSLGIRFAEGWDDPRMSRRFQVRDHWSTPDGQRRAR
jgi:hypothetical protein